MVKLGLSALKTRGIAGILLALLWVFTAMTPALAQAESGATLPRVVAARISTTPERARLIIDLSGTTEFAIVSLDQPDRVGIDVRVSGIDAMDKPALTGKGIVGEAALEQVDPGRARVTLTLNVPAEVQQAYMLDAVDDQPARLVVDLITDSKENFAARVAKDLAAAMAKLEGEAAASTAPPVQTEQVPDAELRGSTDSIPDAVPATPKPDAAASLPVTETRPLVVIDPGHGGIDNGASAPNGIREKDITLAFALQLQDVLVNSGKFDVALTREDDTYLTLNQRVTLARQNKADLFISLHADTFQESDIRGASVYTRDERATDILDKVLADNENKADIVAGYMPAEAKPVVTDILVDLMQREMRRQSFLAATAIVDALKSKVALRRFPVRQADYFVLQAPDIPSILIELGFLSNAKDITNLEDTAWRDKVVGALADGIGDYFNALRQGAK